MANLKRAIRIGPTLVCLRIGYPIPSTGDSHRFLSSWPFDGGKFTSGYQVPNLTSSGCQANLCQHPLKALNLLLLLSNLAVTSRKKAQKGQGLPPGSANIFLLQRDLGKKLTHCQTSLQICQDLSFILLQSCSSRTNNLLSHWPSTF